MDELTDRDIQTAIFEQTRLAARLLMAILAVLVVAGVWFTLDRATTNAESQARDLVESVG